MRGCLCERVCVNVSVFVCVCLCACPPSVDIVTRAVRRDRSFVRQQVGQQNGGKWGDAGRGGGVVIR